MDIRPDETVKSQKVKELSATSTIYIETKFGYILLGIYTQCY